LDDILGFEPVVEEKYLHMGATTEEADMLLFYLPKHGVLVEIGTYWGSTAAYIADHCFDATIISVDPFPGREEVEGWLGSYHNWFHERRKNNFLFVGTSKELSVMSSKEWIDVLFIDGDHGYFSVRKDLDYCLPMVKKTGVIAAHDYCRDGKSEALPGVAKAVDEDKRLERIRVVNSMALLKIRE
jgi:predicted O-methyltransferase YrrM